MTSKQLFEKKMRELINSKGEVRIMSPMRSQYHPYDRIIGYEKHPVKKPKPILTIDLRPITFNNGLGTELIVGVKHHIKGWIHPTPNRYFLKAILEHELRTGKRIWETGKPQRPQ